MTVSMYQELLAQAEKALSNAKTPREQALAFAPLSDVIDSMTWAERIELREALYARHEPKILRNLAYDYDRQAWIQ